MMSARILRQFTRWVALWFVLSLGAAVASPMIQPQAMSLICSSAGAMQVIVQTDDGAIELGSHSLDCPLCANLAAPPAQLLVLAQAAQLAAGAPRPAPTAHPPYQPHQPWQARAPPVFS